MPNDKYEMGILKIRVYRLLVVLFIFLVFGLSACGGGADVLEEPGLDLPLQGSDSAVSGEPADTDDTVGGDATLPEVDEPEGLPDFALRVGDFLIEMDQDFAIVLAALGEPLDEFEAPSCAFDGIDRVFLYPDFEVRTYPKGGLDHVHTIVFENDLIRTTEGGIRLGASLQAVIDAYGEDYEHDTGMYTYTRGLTTLEFLIDDGIVTNILYGYVIE